MAKDIVTRWVVDPKGVEEGARRVEKEIERSSRKASQSAGKLDDAFKKNAREAKRSSEQVQKANADAKVAMDRTRGSLRGVEKGFSLATSAGASFQTTMSGAAREILLSATSMGILGGAIAAVGTGLGFLVRSLQDTKDEMPKVTEEAKRLAEALKQSQETAEVLSGSLAFRREFGRFGTEAEFKLFKARRELEEVREAERLGFAAFRGSSGSGRQILGEQVKLLSQRRLELQKNIEVLEREVQLEQEFLEARKQDADAAEKLRKFREGIKNDAADERKEMEKQRDLWGDLIRKALEFRRAMGEATLAGRFRSAVEPFTAGFRTMGRFFAPAFAQQPGSGSGFGAGSGLVPRTPFLGSDAVSSMAGFRDNVADGVSSGVAAGFVAAATVDATQSFGQALRDSVRAALISAVADAFIRQPISNFLQALLSVESVDDSSFPTGPFPSLSFANDAALGATSDQQYGLDFVYGR